VSLMLWVVLLTGLVRFIRDLRSGGRSRVTRPIRRGLGRALPWFLSLLFGWYTFYSPLTLYLPAWYPDLWPTMGGAALMLTLIAGLAFRVATAFFPRVAAPEDPEDPPQLTAETPLRVSSV